MLTIRDLKKNALILALLPRFLAFCVHCFCRTLRVQIHDDSGIFINRRYSSPVIWVFWHNRMISIPGFFPKKVRRNMFALASPSRDGDYIDRYLAYWGVRCIRGSSNKQSHSSLIKLKTVLEDGYSIAIAPDGPRGPCYDIHSNGILWLARKTRYPLVPVSLNVKAYWELDSWDRTQIPKPFSQAEFRVGKPLYLDNGNQSSYDHWKARIKMQLMELSTKKTNS